MSESTNAHTLSRRQFTRAAAATFLGGLVLSKSSIAEVKKGIVPTMIDAAAAAAIQVHTLRDNISVLEGSGGNIAVLHGNKGKLLVDAGFRVSKTKLASALAQLGSQPLTQLINTHWHVDHTDGNQWVHQAGAAITAHEKTKEHLSVATRVEGWQWTFPPAAVGARPTTVFSASHQMEHDGVKIHLEYYGPAHTDSDISVRFENADILHVGDTWWNGIYPFIDYSTGGSIDGMIRAMRKNLKMATAHTIVVPGHGAIGKRDDLQEYVDMLSTIRDSVAKLKQQGKTVDDCIAAKPTASYDAKFGNFLITPAFFTALVYQGV